MRAVVFGGFLVCLFLGIVLGCSKPERIVGVWTGQYETAGNPVTATVTFHADGRYESVSFMGRQAGLGIRTTDIGNWKSESDGKLRVTLTDIRWEVLGAAPEKTQKSLSKLESAKSAMMAEVNAMGPIPVKWIDDDTYEMAIAGQTYRYSRKK